jgi:hypothetical protein
MKTFPSVSPGLGLRAIVTKLTKRQKGITTQLSNSWTDPHLRHMVCPRQTQGQCEPRLQTEIVSSGAHVKAQTIPCPPGRSMEVYAPLCSLDDFKALEDPLKRLNILIEIVSLCSVIINAVQPIPQHESTIDTLHF